MVRILKEELEAEQEEKEELFYNNNFTVFDFVGHNKEQVELLLGNEFEIKEKDGRFFVVRKQKKNSRRIMKIETKYNIGDEVWIIAQNTICNLKITNIMISYYPTFNSIKYGFGATEKTRMFDLVEEKFVCSSKEELLKNL